MLTKIYQKTCIATALGVATLAAMPVQATTWAGTGSPQPISITGTLSAFNLPGKWQWAVGGKTDFAIDTATTPMTNNNKTLTITMTEDLPLVAGRMTHPKLGGSRANIAVTFPNVVTGGNTYTGSELDRGGRALGLTVNAPITLSGANSNVVGYATFKASGAGISYEMPVTSTPGVASTIEKRAIAPTAATQLCSGLVGNVPDDTDPAFVNAGAWMVKLDATWIRTDTELATLYLDASRVTNSALPVDQPAPLVSTTSLAKLSGLQASAQRLVLSQCGLGLGNGDTLVLNFNNTINTETDWVVRLAPTVVYY